MLLVIAALFGSLQVSAIILDQVLIKINQTEMFGFMAGEKLVRLVAAKNKA